jgi:uncharacterized circularly permuted ATP-grasp superfamily protein
VSAPYRPVPGVFDEAVAPDGSLRPEARAAMHAVGRHDVGELTRAVREGCAAAGVRFTSETGDAEFLIDPVPRVFTAAEWAEVEAGVAQRVRALNAFVADVYGGRAIVEAGVLPARAVDTAEHHEPRLRRVRPPGGIWIGIAGADIVRGPDGRLRVLEDNTRTPSGIGYAVAARGQLGALLEVPPAARPKPVDGALDLLRSTLEAAAASPSPALAVLSDGPGNSAWWEHRWAAEGLGIPLVTPDRLEVRERRLTLDGAPLDVVYRRTDDCRADSPVGELLLEPLAAGTLGVVNGFGTGVADDKLLHAYVEDMVRFYLGEEPRLPSVRTLDLERPGVLEEALDRLEELVVKPRAGYGGMGVVIAPHAQPADRDRARADLRAEPGAYVAQELITLSTHPTVVDGRLAPRHVDLRPFGFLTAEGARVLPGGLTRVAFDEGALVVNSSQNGGAKDTWVLP